MKSKIYTPLALLFVAVFASVSLMAQPRWNKDNNDRRNDDYNNRRNDDRYDNRHNERDDDRRDYYDKDDRYRRQNGDFDNGHFIIRHRPDAPYMQSSRRPSPYHVWVDGEWMFSRGQYVYQPGYWAMPVRGMSYVQGHWERAHRGWFWAPGYWARPNRW